MVTFAQQTIGFSGADLGGLLSEAAIYAVRYNITYIDTCDVEEAFDKATVGIRRPDAVVGRKTDDIHKNDSMEISKEDNRETEETRIRACPPKRDT